MALNGRHFLARWHVYNAAMPESLTTGRVTLRTLRKWIKAGVPIPMLTCYDATTAGKLWQGGVPCMLVGDTAAEMVFGHDSTIYAELDLMLALTAAVRRGAPDAFIMGDMPFGSYQCGENEAVANAIRFLKQANADAVKLEVDQSNVPLVERMVHAGIPVVAHLGSRPQHVRQQGGYRSAGRTQTEAAALVAEAEYFIRSGVSMLLLEAVPNEVSQRVVQAARSPQDGQPIPVIGCGAGSACHGHVVVLHDLVGLTDWHPPFVQPVESIGAAYTSAAQKWCELLASGDYLDDDHPYRMKD